MRFPLPLALCSVALAGALGLPATPLAAQAPPPPRLEPIPEPPPRPIGVDGDTSSQRDIRVSPGEPQRAIETVVEGKRAIHVINQDGSEYYLIEDLGDGAVTGQSPGDTRVRVPRWVIKRF